MKALIAAVAVGVFAAGVGTGSYATAIESATVKISLAGWKLDGWSTAHGATSGGQFQTQRLQVTLSESATGTATGSAGSGGTYATGKVQFSLNPRPCTTYCTLPPAAPVGSIVCYAIPTGGVPCYAVQSPVTCYCGEYIPVRAQRPGAWYNAPPGLLFELSWNLTAGTVYATDPAGITGGSDGTSYRVVKQSDLDAASTSLQKQLTADLVSAMRLKAQNLHYVADPTPAITVSSTASAGASASTFQVTASGVLGATAFRDADAQAAIAQSLDGKVPDGFHLFSEPEVSNLEITDSNAQGDVTISGEAIGYMVARVSVDKLRSSLRGLDIASARRMILGIAPLSTIDIRQSPLSSPWLPLNTSRISISIDSRVTPVN